MKRTLWVWVAAIGLVASMAACSDDTNVPAKDSSTIHDGAGHDATVTPDGMPIKDGAPGQDTTGVTAKSCQPSSIVPQCQNDGECTAGTGNTGKCCLTNHLCIRCENDTDCTTATLGKYCNTTTHLCLQCKADADCTKGLANTGQCDTTLGLCIKCDADKDCTDAMFGKYCHTTTHRCISCKADTDCAKGIANTGKCHKAFGTCLACDGDPECTAAFPSASYVCK